MWHSKYGLPRSTSDSKGCFVRMSSNVLIRTISSGSVLETSATLPYCPDFVVLTIADNRRTNFLSQLLVSLRRSRQSYGSNPFQLVHNRFRIRTSVPSYPYDSSRSPHSRWLGCARPLLPSNDPCPEHSGPPSPLCSDVFPVRGVGVVVSSTATPIRLNPA
jgi:hypothetical protein